MNRFDMEQLNGILKGKNEDIFLLEKYKEQLSKQEAQIVDGCIHIIHRSKRKVEEVQVKDTSLEVNKLLNRFE
ncbi:MAG: hypothetical protein M0T81_00245 [Thermoplasmatales archaeon]|nr:hypothetical protein [Candidatus Thermoplasmatota archaeon]MDA8142396.1 hypothetical protein [Thermoplasmatales archaeon]